MMRCPSCRRPVAEDAAACPYCKKDVTRECSNCGGRVPLRAPYCNACAWSFKAGRVLRRKSGTIRAVGFTLIIVSVVNAVVTFAYLRGKVMEEELAVSPESEFTSLAMPIVGPALGLAAAAGVACTWGIFRRTSWAPLFGILLAGLHGLLVLVDVFFMVYARGLILAVTGSFLMATASVPLLNFTLLVMHGILIFVVAMVLTKRRFRRQFGLSTASSEPGSAEAATDGQ